MAEAHGWRTKGSLEDFSPPPLRSQPAPAQAEVLPPAAPVAVQQEGGGTAGVTSLKASAGSLFSRLKDSSRAMVQSVQQSMVGRSVTTTAVC